MSDLTTPRPWTLAAGQLPRIVQRGYGVSICGLHKIGRGEQGERIAVANGRLILNAIVLRDQLVDALNQALGQWAMYADMEPDRDLKAEDSPEGDLYRAAAAVLAKAQGATE